jgi:hypothetical protein
MRISNGNYIQNVDDAKSNTEPQSVADIFPTVGRCTSVYSKRNRGWQLLKVDKYRRQKSHEGVVLFQDGTMIDNHCPIADLNKRVIIRL